MRQILNILACIVLLCAALPAMAEPASKETVRPLLSALEATCGWPKGQAATMPASEKGDDPFLQAIKPIQNLGTDAVPALASLANDANASRFHRRLAGLLIARLEHPERFRQVQDMLDSAQPVRGTERMRHVKSVLDSAPQLPPVPLVMIESGHRDFLNKYQQPMKEYRALVDSYCKPTDEQGRVRPAMSENEERRLHDEVLELRRRHGLRWPVWSKLTGMPPISREYLRAWEETALRPLPWRWKEFFFQAVVAAGDPNSVPILTVVYRQSCAVAMPPPVRRGLCGQLATALSAAPSRDALSEVVELLRYERTLREDIQVLKGDVCWGIVKSAKWMQLLAELRADPAFANDAGWLLEVLGPYVKVTSPKTKTVQ